MPELKNLHREEEAEDAYINQKVQEYRSAWAEYETKIIPALCDVLGLQFKQNIIDAYIAPFSNSFSDPMVISTKYSADRFVDVFAHELTHRLLTDNTKLPLTTDRKLSEYWAELFGTEHSFKVLAHIPVHAALEYIFTDILNESNRLQRDKEFSAKYDDYKKAWDYVEAVGYLVILTQMKDLYQGF